MKNVEARQMVGWQTTDAVGRVFGEVKSSPIHAEASALVEGFIKKRVCTNTAHPAHVYECLDLFEGVVSKARELLKKEEEDHKKDPSHSSRLRAPPV